jgi:hypothetical protein
MYSANDDDAALYSAGRVKKGKKSEHGSRGGREVSNTKWHVYKALYTHFGYQYTVDNDDVAEWFTHGGWKGEKGKKANMARGSKGIASSIWTGRIGQIDTNNDGRRGIKDSPTRCQGVQPAGGEMGENAKIKPATEG